MAKSLNTLKDIEVKHLENSCEYCTGPSREGLKEEAIKWIKEIDSIRGVENYRKFCLNNFDKKDYEYLDDNALMISVHAIAFGYKYFFNITEDDLK